MTRIIGISAYYHDSAAALIEDGRIVCAAQEERFTRIKNDPAFPEHALRFCLQGLEADDIDYVVFYEKPFLKFERLLETYLAFAPHGFGQFRRAIPIWVKEKLFQKQLLRSSLKTVLNSSTAPQLLFAQHHQSHAASAFFAGPYDDAAVLCLDGVGEWATTSAWHGREGQLEPLWQINFPHSIGLLYSAFTQLCGFRVNEGEYKLMGLAPYGEPVYVDVIKRELIDIKPDGTFRLNLEYFDYCTGEHMINDQFEALFDVRTRAEADPILAVHMDLAASIQVVTEEVVQLLATKLRQETNCTNLCLAGGVALNCVSNGRLRRSGLFENVWVQPAAGDAGGAIGAALAGWHQYLGHAKPTTEHDGMQSALLGQYYRADELTDVLDASGLAYEQFEMPALNNRVAELLAAGSIVGWFQGRAEFGPRALGSRSILADARADDMQAKLNQSIKFRESFRPFAPIVLIDEVGTYFDTQSASPYMSFVEQVSAHLRETPVGSQTGLDTVAQRRSTLPAITHVDYSARIQTVDEQHPSLFGLLNAFRELTGYGVLINTSFNVKDEPIVESPQDAVNCFNKTHMDVLVLGEFIVMKADNAVAPSSNVAESEVRDSSLLEDEQLAPVLPAQETPASLRKFGRSLAGLLIVFFGLLLPYLFNYSLPLWPYLIAVPLWLLAEIAPVSIRRVHRFWFALGEALGRITTPIVMGVVFYFLVTPIGLLKRAVGASKIPKAPDADLASYRAQPLVHSDMSDPF